MHRRPAFGSLLAPLLVLWLPQARLAAAVPTSDPAAEYGQSWTGQIRWGRVVSIADVPGSSADERIARAQDMLTAGGGGVIYFPPGTYEIGKDIKLRDGIILRGADPGAMKDARKDTYRLSSRLVFPRYSPRMEGAGTPITEAFKGIQAEHPAGASRCGVVHLALERGHIHLGDDGGQKHRAGHSRIVLG